MRKCIGCQKYDKLGADLYLVILVAIIQEKSDDINIHSCVKRYLECGVFFDRGYIFFQEGRSLLHGKYVAYQLSRMCCFNLWKEDCLSVFLSVFILMTFFCERLI